MGAAISVPLDEENRKIRLGRMDGYSELKLVDSDMPVVIRTKKLLKLLGRSWSQERKWVRDRQGIRSVEVLLAS